MVGNLDEPCALRFEDVSGGAEETYAGGVGRPSSSASFVLNSILREQEQRAEGRGETGRG